MAKTRESCVLCQIVANNIPSYKIYEDEIAIAALDFNGANPGHCFIIPKNHYPIIEQVPDGELGHLFSIANRISSAIFESLKAQGTNVFVANGIPAGQTVAHFMINVIPRRENDGINLQWSPKQLSEEEMSTVELKLRENMQGMAVESQGKREMPKAHSERPKPFISDEGEEDYFMSQLRKIP